MTINIPRVPVRVMTATKRTTKTGKTMYTQDVQIDQEGKRSVYVERRYFEEAQVLPAGEYTARQTYYTTTNTDKNGYLREHLCVALGDLKKVN